MECRPVVPRAILASLVTGNSGIGRVYLRGQNVTEHSVLSPFRKYERHFPLYKGFGESRSPPDFEFATSLRENPPPQKQYFRKSFFNFDFPFYIRRSVKQPTMYNLFLARYKVSRFNPFADAREANEFALCRPSLSGVPSRRSSSVSLLGRT